MRKQNIPKGIPNKTPRPQSRRSSQSEDFKNAFIMSGLANRIRIEEYASIYCALKSSVFVHSLCLK
jgi:hypothetical protein